MSRKEYNLRPIWDALLDIYQVFANICERNGLRYCADSGTALGAVRHGGFIPWDDDMDIQMPRPDYEKFAKVVKNELPKGLAWLDKTVSNDYPFAFGKIIVTDSDKVAKIASKSSIALKHGLFIDIFPLDGYPDTKVGRLLRKIQSRLWEFQLKYDSGWDSCNTLLKKAFWCIGFFTASRKFKIRSHRELSELFEKRARQYEFGATEYCVSIGVSRFFDDKPFPVKYFGRPQKIKFDRAEMLVQENVDGYLRRMFGDYMQLPPENRRVPAHAIRPN